MLYLLHRDQEILPFLIENTEELFARKFILYHFQAKVTPRGNFHQR